MRNTINTGYIEGLLYDTTVETRVSGPGSKNPGTAYLAGDVIIATDSKCTNLVKVKYRYATPTFANGNINRNYEILKKIADGEIKSVMSDGNSEANYLSISKSSILENKFFPNGSEEMVSTQGFDGGFISVIPDFKKDRMDDRSSFETDFLITRTFTKEKVSPTDPSIVSTELLLKGFVFAYDNSLQEVTFTVTNPKAIDYFVGLDISPKHFVFTKVKGALVSTVYTTVTTEESAFGGEDLVKEETHSDKSFVINWARVEPYPWDDESSITRQEFENALAERELDIASLKKRSAERNANADNASIKDFSQKVGVDAIPSIAHGGYNF